MDTQQTHASITIRIPADIMALLRVLAKQHDRSLNGEITAALREYTGKHKDTKQDEKQ